MTKLSCFKANDIRGHLGDELNEEICWKIGHAYSQYLSAKVVAVGADVRLSSPNLKDALIEGLRSAGTEVWDLGLTGTEEIYFAVFSQNFDGGLEVTGSHNPLDDNGLKLVSRQARPLNSDNGLFNIRDLVESESFSLVLPKGSLKSYSFKNEYIKHLLSYIDLENIPPLKIVVNPGHGTAGPILELIEKELSNRGAPIEFIKIGFEPDGSFPLGVPNPLLPEHRHFTSETVRRHKAQLGLAWDGDFDRCFFFDDQGSFIEGYYLVGLLAELFLSNYPGASIIHDPRLTWNTIEIVERFGGKPIVSKTGHAFIKEKMRSERAIYGGEMSAHHYFADFAYCDSGMIPWLVVLELLGQKKTSINALVAERMAMFPCSGELNYIVSNPTTVMAAVENHWGNEPKRRYYIDGLTLEMPFWRFNLRSSNTEPLLRLNVESRGLAELVTEKVSELERVILTDSCSRKIN